jgi:GT2 family glycosyltransferase
MKYSIILPYYNRIHQLKSTLASFRALYSGRKDYEVIIVEDLKNNQNAEWSKELKKTIKEFGDNHKYVLGNSQSWSPAPAFNLGAQNAIGEYFIISNPECFHKVDILKGLDEEFKRNPDCYVVCACLAVRQESMNMLQAQEVRGVWYQHSQHRNALCHFCSAISRKQYQEIGGFDEEYVNGMCFDDDDFRNKIQQANIEVTCRDDLAVIHQSHSGDKPANFKELHDINKRYFLSKWGEESLTAEKIPLPPGQRTRRFSRRAR